MLTTYVLKQELVSFVELSPETRNSLLTSLGRNAIVLRDKYPKVYLRQELSAERIYLRSLGSNQGNAQVHSHIVPLPDGGPYHEQQLGIYKQKDVLKIPENEMASLVRRIRERMERLNGQNGS